MKRLLCCEEGAEREFSFVSSLDLECFLSCPSSSQRQSLSPVTGVRCLHAELSSPPVTLLSSGSPPASLLLSATQSDVKKDGKRGRVS